MIPHSAPAAVPGGEACTEPVEVTPPRAWSNIYFNILPAIKSRGKMPCSQKGQTYWNYSKERKRQVMAKCANCGKSTTFGHNRSFSQRATNRKFKPNLQKTIVMEKGRVVHKVLCTKCIKAMGKSLA
jgi:large subunit ribosomal protein L28